MTQYLPARIVSYEVSGNDELLSSLIVMKECDQEFSEKALNHAYIWKVFITQVKHKLSNETRRKLSVELAIAIIVNGLKNRARFAMRQKERLQSHLNMLHPSELNRVIHEVNCELETVIDLIVHFTGFDQDLKQMSMDINALHRDDMGVSQPCQIPDEE